MFGGFSLGFSMKETTKIHGHFGDNLSLKFTGLIPGDPRAWPSQSPAMAVAKFRSRPNAQCFVVAVATAKTTGK